MPNLGPTELIIILIIVLAIFGAGKLASLGGALGKGVRDFKREVRKATEEDEEEEEEGGEAAASESTSESEEQTES